MHQLMWNFIIVVCAQGSACQCNVFHIIICKLGESVHWQGRDINARKGEVRVEGTEEVQGAAYIILLCFHIPLAHFWSKNYHRNSCRKWMKLNLICFLGEGGRGGTLDFKWPSDRDDRMGAKIKTQKKPLGFKQNRQKIPAPKFNPPKIPCRISEP